MVVVADAGMLSAANLNAVEDAGFSFIVGSRISKAPYDLAEHFKRRGDYFADGQILEPSRVMGTGKAARTRRIVYQYSFKRRSVTTGRSTPVKGREGRRRSAPDRLRPVRDRHADGEGKKAEVNWAVIKRAGSAPVSRVRDQHRRRRPRRICRGGRLPGSVARRGIVPHVHG